MATGSPISTTMMDKINVHVKKITLTVISIFDLLALNVTLQNIKHVDNAAK